MSAELFGYIIMQLKEMDFRGWLTLQCNNEPLMDKDIIRKLEFCRTHLPNAKYKMFTNGTLLTVDKFDKLMHLLDHMFLDNYTEDQSFTKASLMAMDYMKTHPELSDKLTIFVTRTSAKRGSRAGLVRNRIFQQLKSPCWFPFTQLIIRPDGKTSLCCNEALGRITLADLTKESIKDAWMNENYTKIRKIMKEEGRKAIHTCFVCDTFECSSDLLIRLKSAIGGNTWDERSYVT